MLDRHLPTLLLRSAAVNCDSCETLMSGVAASKTFPRTLGMSCSGRSRTYSSQL
jgi:hypothetical protein